jgi:hypothetical protein
MIPWIESTQSPPSSRSNIARNKMMRKARPAASFGLKKQLVVIAAAFACLFQVQHLAEARLGSSLRLVHGKIRFRSSGHTTRRRKNIGSIVFPPSKEQEEEKEEQHHPHQNTIATTISSVYDSYRHHAPIGIETTTTTTRSKIIDSTDLVSTDAAALAKDFEQALVAVNQGHKDLHVGNLLSACGRLETTMRHIGFTQSANDISGNVQKIRNVYDRLPRDERDSISTIVQYELETGVHGGTSKKNTLKDPSATVGFPWLGRSINYQYDMFRYMLDGDETPYDAARHAYEADLKPHLSWPLQKVCQAAMTRLKPIQKTEMFSKIGGFSEECYGSREEQATKRDLRQVMDSWQPMLSKWREIFTDLELDQI